MALVDFTNPDAVAWYPGKLRRLLDMGVDASRPTSASGSRPTSSGTTAPTRSGCTTTTRSSTTSAVFELLEDERGEGEAVLFARSATAGGQQFPVHWGGDCESTFESMAETLRGGLSLASSRLRLLEPRHRRLRGHAATPAVFKRWVRVRPALVAQPAARLDSYRVPWVFDEEAVDVAAPVHAAEALADALPRPASARTRTSTGVPMMRPMLLEFPDDPGCGYVATAVHARREPARRAGVHRDGEVNFYVPEGVWTTCSTGEEVTGPRWVRETHDFLTLPLLRPPGHGAAGGGPRRTGRTTTGPTA